MNNDSPVTPSPPSAMPDPAGSASRAERPLSRTYRGGVALFVAASAIVLLVNALVVRNQLIATSPVSPWESGIIVEGWRSSQGMPVYTAPDAAETHGTHMYGPFCAELLERLFTLTGPSAPWSRVPSLLCALALCVVLCKVCGVHGGWSWFCAFSLAFGIDYRSSNIFAENRPDAIAFLFGLISLTLLCLSYLKRSVATFLLALVCLLLGVFFKQTAAVAAVVFGAVVIFDGRYRLPVRAVVGAIPVAVVFAALALMKWLRPEMYYFVVTIPSSYKIPPQDFMKTAWLTLGALPLLWLAFWDLTFDRNASTKDFRTRAILIALCVTFPLSLLARVKIGGGDNSMIPFHLAVTSLLICRMEPLLDRIRGQNDRVRSWLSGGVLGVMLILNTFPNPGRLLPYFKTAPAWDADYREAIDWVKEVDGNATSPEDPTILVAGAGKPCLNVYLEVDVRPKNGNWQPGVPEVVLDELRRAEFVVNVKAYRTISGDLINEDLLASLGLRMVKENGHFSLWGRQ